MLVDHLDDENTELEAIEIGRRELNSLLVARTG